MPVPIENIARDQLHLTILEAHFSEDPSILVQTCFTDGLTEIYDPGNDECREIPVKAGTVLIDPDTFLKRNFGTKRNTIAHKCVHWVYHRKYYVAANRLGNQQTVGKVFQMVLNLSKQNQFVYAGLIQKGKWVIEQFAGFYQVSKQSAAIRLQELGYLS